MGHLSNVLSRIHGNVELIFKTSSLQVYEEKKVVKHILRYRESLKTLKMMMNELLPFRSSLDSNVSNIIT